MEKIYRTTAICCLIAFAALITGCSSKPKISQEDDAAFKKVEEEFEKVVQVEVLEEPPAAKKEDKKAPAKKRATKKKKPAPTLKQPKWAMETKKRQPEIEDTEGFEGRRPVVDPFRPGEKVVLSVNYFNMTAGDVALEIHPFKLVNDRKAYHFRATIKSNRTFSIFYKVDNYAETFLDFETMIPQTLTYHANESSRRKEARTFFDWDKMEAAQWRYEVHKQKGENKDKITWELEPYSQNVLSALFYLRTFTLKPGKKLAFRVADDGKNYLFTGEVLRRETLDTDIGPLKTVVIQPQFSVEGSFKPSGDTLIWLTDDDRKFIVRLETKVKIGTLVGKVKAIEKGSP